jgi:type II secretory pathway predicted ATPase ExeA
MYERHFGLNVKPFAMTPDPEFLYPSRQHAMALTMLEYGLESQAAFTLLTGEIGSGKTTLVRSLLRRLGDQVVVGIVSNTHARFSSIQRWALSALGVAGAGDSDVAVYEALARHVTGEFNRGRRTLLIFDEAQNLSIDLLEELRLLSNLNTEGALMLQIVLIGQPELREKLAQPQLRQFAQRVSVDYQLHALSRTETRAYIEHRLRVAGRSRPLFQAEAVEFIFARTKGVPRLVNMLCDYALVYAYAEQQSSIAVELVAQIVRDRRSGQAMATVAEAQIPSSLGVESGGPA